MAEYTIKNGSNEARAVKVGDTWIKNEFELIEGEKRKQRQLQI